MTKSTFVPRPSAVRRAISCKEAAVSSHHDMPTRARRSATFRLRPECQRAARGRDRIILTGAVDEIMASQQRCGESLRVGKPKEC